MRIKIHWFKRSIQLYWLFAVTKCPSTNNNDANHKQKFIQGDYIYIYIHTYKYTMYIAWKWISRWINDSTSTDWIFHVQVIFCYRSRLLKTYRNAGTRASSAQLFQYHLDYCREMSQMCFKTIFALFYRIFQIMCNFVAYIHLICEVIEYRNWIWIILIAITAHCHISDKYFSIIIFTYFLTHYQEYLRLMGSMSYLSSVWTYVSILYILIQVTSRS